MTATTLTATTEVVVNVPAGEVLLTTAWWPKGVVTGTVDKVYKNGNCAVSIDQLQNRSDDRKRTMTLPAAWLVAR